MIFLNKIEQIVSQLELIRSDLLPRRSALFLEANFTIDPNKLDKILFIVTSSESQLYNQSQSYKISYPMVKGTFVLSAHQPKTMQERRRVNFRRTGVRFIVVVLAILVVFVYEYAFDNPSALEEFIQHNYEHSTHEPLGQAKFNLLYAVYSFPNIIIPLIGGTLIDRIGARVVFIITCMFCVLGQFIFSMGGLQNLFWLMIIGRVVFGIGGEVLQGSQSTIISNWFKPHQLPMILGICISFPKMGSALNNYVTPIIAEHYNNDDPDNYENVGIPMFIGFFGMCFGLICTIILADIDRKSEKQERQIHQSALLSSGVDKKFNRKEVSQLTGGDLRKEQSVRIEVSTVIKNNEAASQQVQHAQGQHINFKDIMKLPACYWILIIIATLCEALFIPFLDNANKYYVSVFTGINSPDEAGIYLVVPYVVGALSVPILGYFVDKVEKKSYLILLTSFFFFLTYLIMFYTETNQELRKEEWIRWLPVSTMGIGIGLFCTVIIPTLPMIVNPKLLGTAFGLMEMMQNLALGVFPILIGAIRETSQDNELGGFHLQSMFLFVIGCVCLGMSFILKSVDLVTGSMIDRKDFRKRYIKEVLKDDVDVDQD